MNMNNYGKENLNGRMEDSMSQDTAIRHQRGGMYFEDFEAGRVYQHRLRRTVTQMDNMLFSNMTLNPQPLHIDRHFCETETEWGKPLMNSLFTLGLMIGISVNDLTVGTTIANLGMTETKFPHPLFENDTVHCTTEVLGQARIELASECGYRGIPASRLQPGRQAGRRMPAAGIPAEAAGLISALQPPFFFASAMHSRKRSLFQAMPSSSLAGRGRIPTAPPQSVLLALRWAPSLSITGPK